MTIGSHSGIQTAPIPWHGIGRAWISNMSTTCANALSWTILDTFWGLRISRSRRYRGPMTWTAPQLSRSDAPYVSDERVMLDGWLDFHRQTLLLKCAGLNAEQLKMRSVSPSSLSLLGLVRHLSMSSGLGSGAGLLTSRSNSCTAATRIETTIST